MKKTIATLAISGGLVLALTLTSLADMPDGALLAKGIHGTTSWQVFVHPDRGIRGGHRPCFEPVSGRSSFSLCGNLRDHPVIAAKSDGAGRREFTVLVLGYKNSVHSVRLFLGGRRARRVALTQAPEAIRRRARVREFRYAVRVFSGSFCLRRVVALGATERVLDPGVEHSCDE